MFVFFFFFCFFFCFSSKILHVVRYIKENEYLLRFKRKITMLSCLCIIITVKFKENFAVCQINHFTFNRLEKPQKRS